MSVLRRVKLRTPDGIESIEYPLGVDAENVEVANGENLSQRLARIDEDLENNEEDIAAVGELAGTNKQNIGANEIRIDALERRSASVDKKPYYFDTVADMKAYQKLVEGDMAITLGYYEINDGGNGEYKIVNSSNKYYEELNNDLKAELIIKNNIINFRQLGAKSQAQDNIKYDNKNYLDKYINILNSNKDRIKLYIPSGIWYFSSTQIFYQRGFYIFGDECMTQRTSSNKGTIVTTLNNDQNILWKIGEDNLMQTNCVLKNILFSTADYVWSSSLNTFTVESLKKVTDTVVRIINTQYLITDNLFFEHLYGQALGISSSWELYFKLLNFRAIAGFEKSIINFEPLSTLKGNISACNFSSIMFEGFSKNLINFSSNCGLVHSDFNTINIEDFPTSYIGEESITTTDSIDFTNFNHLSIFNLAEDTNIAGIIVNNILLNNIATHYTIYEETNYIFDTIIQCGNASKGNMIINNINAVGIGKDCNLIYALEDNQVSVTTQFLFNNYNSNNLNYTFIFNVQGFKRKYKIRIIKFNFAKC